MPVQPIEDLSDPRLADYRHVPDPELLRRGEIFVAEGRLVVRTLLADSPFVTRSVLVTETALRGAARRHRAAPGDLPVFVVTQGTIQHLTGFNIHRGCLAIGERPAAVALEEFLETVRRDTALDRRGARLQLCRNRNPEVCATSGGESPRRARADRQRRQRRRHLPQRRRVRRCGRRPRPELLRPALPEVDQDVDGRGAARAVRAAPATGPAHSAAFGRPVSPSSALTPRPDALSHRGVRCRAGIGPPGAARWLRRRRA